MELEDGGRWWEYVGIFVWGANSLFFPEFWGERSLVFDLLRWG